MSSSPRRLASAPRTSCRRQPATSVPSKVSGAESEERQPFLEMGNTRIDRTNRRLSTSLANNILLQADSRDFFPTRQFFLGDRPSQNKGYTPLTYTSCRPGGSQSGVPWRFCRIPQNLDRMFCRATETLPHGAVCILPCIPMGNLQDWY